MDVTTLILENYSVFVVVMITILTGVPLLMKINDKLRSEGADLVTEIVANKNGFISGWIYGLFAGCFWVGTVGMKVLTGDIIVDVFAVLLPTAIMADQICHTYLAGGKILDNLKKPETSLGNVNK